MRMNLLPLAMASLAPSIAPRLLQIAMGMAILHRMVPLKTKRRMEPRFVERLTNFALALACRKSRPKTVIKASIRKLPAPGPMKPS